MRSRISLTITGLLAASSLAGSCFAGPQYRQITILHTNDTHGHLVPFSCPAPSTASASEQAAHDDYQNIGGIARRATLVHRIEREVKRNVLLIDAGDQLDGTPFSVVYMGEADSAAMAAARYDLKTFGNHEFSASIADFERNARLAGCPTLCANLVDRRTGKPYEPRYKIMDFDGVKVAFFGLVEPAPTYKAAKQAYDFLDPVETAQKLAPELKKQADIVVAITHIGYKEDVRLAALVPDIDAIVGGHSHTPLTTPFIIRSWSEFDARAFQCGTVIVQAGQWGEDLGRLDLRLRSDGVGPYTLMSYKSQLIPVTSDIPEDPATATVVSKYTRPIWSEFGEVVGEAQSDFLGYGDEERKGDSTMMNLVCDAMRHKFEADAAVFNTGGIRGDLARGPIRMWDIATVLPFSNNIMTMELTGKRLKQALAELKPGVSGIVYLVGLHDELVSATINGAPIDDSATYKVITNDWFAEFGFKDIKATDTKLTVRDTLKQYINHFSPINTSSGNRRTNMGSQPPA